MSAVSRINNAIERTIRIERIERTLDLLLQALNAGITSERFDLIQAAIREWKEPHNADA